MKNLLSVVGYFALMLVVYPVLIVLGLYVSALVCISLVDNFDATQFPFFLLMVFGGMSVAFQWFLAHVQILWTGVVMGFGIGWFVWRVLVDKVFPWIVEVGTERRKREWNSRQHEDTTVE